MARAIQCEDHLGNVFSNKKERANFWGIDSRYVDNREKRGWSLEKALTTPVEESTCTDHLGNVFNSKRERAEFYGIDERIIDTRQRQSGWSLEKALTTPLRSQTKKCTDHLGNVFNSKRERAEFYGLTEKTIQSREYDGWELEKIFTTPQVERCNENCTDHTGRIFKNKTEMGKYYGIKPKTITYRLENGWSLEKALTTPTREILIEDPITHEKCNIKYLSKKYSIPEIKIRYRLNEGYSLTSTLELSFLIANSYNKINKTKYNLTVAKRIKPGKDVFECYIDNGDGTSTFRIMSCDMIDEYCIDQYKKLHNIQ